MIIVLKPSATEEQITKFTNMLKESYDVKVNKWDGVHSTVLGLIGDTTKIDIEYIDAQDIVENVKRVQEPYKKANRKFHPDNTVIKINDNVTIGDGSLHIMAGPCSVESEEQIVQIGAPVGHQRALAEEVVLLPGAARLFTGLDAADGPAQPAAGLQHRRDAHDEADDERGHDGDVNDEIGQVGLG